MKTTTKILIAAFSAMALGLNASVIESFDYGTGLLGNKAVTGTGLTGNWAGNYNNANTPPFTGSAGGVIVDNWSYDTPTGYGFTPSGNQFRVAGFSESHAQLATPLATNADSTTYISFFYRLGTTGNVNSSYANVGLNSTAANNTDHMNFGKNSGGTNFGMQFGGAGYTSSSVSITADTDYLIVLRLQISETGTDSLSFKAYTSADTITSEPITWDQTITGNASGSFTGIGFRSGSGQTDFRVDEFRMGDSFAAVAIPEPSTLVMLGIALGSLLLFRRRHAE